MILKKESLDALDIIEKAAYSHQIDAMAFAGLTEKGELVGLEDNLLRPADPDTMEGFVDLGSALLALGHLVYTEEIGFKGIVFEEADGGLKLLNPEGNVSLFNQGDTETPDTAPNVDDTDGSSSNSTIVMEASETPKRSKVTRTDEIASQDETIGETKEGKPLPKETAVKKTIENAKKSPMVQANGNGLDNGHGMSIGQNAHNYNTADAGKNQAQGRGLADITRDVKSRLSVKDYAEMNGFAFRSVGDSYRSTSIIGGSNKTCLAVRKDNPNYFTDFKSGDSGDVITFCAALHHDGEFYPALQELAEITGVELNGAANTGIYSKRAKLPDDVKFWSEKLLENPECLGYLKKRLGDKADATIKRLKLGYSPNRNRIMIPYLKGARPVYFAGRYFGKADKGHPKYYKAPTKDYGEQPCWGEDTLRRESPLVLAEGAFDAFSFEQEGYSVLSMFGGNPSQHQKQIIRNAARAKAEQGEDTILVFDADEAGKGFTRQMANDLFECHIPFKTATVPEGFKDVSEYYETHRSVDAILSTAIDGLAYVVNLNIGNMTQFEKFARKVSRNLSELDVTMLFEIVREKNVFNTTWLKGLEKACKAKPKESQIVAEILRDHDLISPKGLKIFEFEDGVWAEKTEEDIKRYAMECAGVYATNHLNKECLGHIRTECNSNEIDFNRKWLIQFQNGVLDFSTEELRPPRRSDYIVGISPFDYDPNAECPLFERTVHELMSGNEEKIRFLKQTMGYVAIAPKNYLHKCLYWIGQGGNGKGVLLRVLQDVLGDVNVSHVGISQLDKPWNRLRIQNSRVNISAEEMENLYGVESYFKAVTGGDTVDGDLKHLNASVEFDPRAIWLVSANFEPKMKDPSNAILRRLLFIKFEEDYLDEGVPVGNHQHEVDPHLNEKLREELPGIFNWLYDGYREFRANGEKFDYSSEHLEVMREFKKDMDIVADFIETHFMDECRKWDEFDTEKAFDAFDAWCERYNRKKMAYNTFTKRFKKRFLEEPTVWRKRNHHEKSGYRRKPGVKPPDPAGATESDAPEPIDPTNHNPIV